MLIAFFQMKASNLAFTGLNIIICNLSFQIIHLHIHPLNIYLLVIDYLRYVVLFKIRNEFYADTQGVLLVYDLSNRSSFEALNSWMDEMEHNMSSVADMDNITFIVCANKV